jgi:hypothetical protein
MIWVDPSNGDLVNKIFGEANITTITMPDGKNLLAVSWQGVVNIYDMLYKDHYRLMYEAKLTLE